MAAPKPWALPRAVTSQPFGLKAFHGLAHRGYSQSPLRANQARPVAAGTGMYWQRPNSLCILPGHIQDCCKRVSHMAQG